MSKTDPRKDAEGYAYYAEPPHMPSRLIRTNTNRILGPSESELKNPTAASKLKVVNMIPCKMAGRERSRAGKGGMPRDMEDRDRKTVVWYTSCAMPSSKLDRTVCERRMRDGHTCHRG